jgi:phage baseplate assembly protein W
VDDIFHVWGTDLTVGASGDLAVAAQPTVGQQRILRRLLTNPGDYIWQLDYGAGLAGFVGEPANASQITAIIRSQIFKESAVARTPEPIVDVQVSPAGAVGTVYVHLRYADSQSGESQVLSFSVTG